MGGTTVMRIFDTLKKGEHESNKQKSKEADQEAHTFITNELAKLLKYDSDDPVADGYAMENYGSRIISEEDYGTKNDEATTDMEADWEDRKKLQYIWMVDPLDGSSDFAKMFRGFFTINIALIDVQNDNEPIFGMVYEPCYRVLWYGGDGKHAWRKTCSGTVWHGGHKRIQVKTYANEADAKIFPVSNSHCNLATAAYMALYYPKLKKVVKSGSSTKILKVAEGSADVYVRLSGICEWDIAASYAVLKAAGGDLIQLETCGVNPEAVVLNGDTDRYWGSNGNPETSRYKDYLQYKDSTRPTNVKREEVTPGAPFTFNQRVMSGKMAFKAVCNITQPVPCTWLNDAYRKWKHTMDFKNDRDVHSDLQALVPTPENDA